MRIKSIIARSLLLTALTGLASVTESCAHRHENATTDPIDTAVLLHPLPDTLRVATLYSPTSYFIYREQEMGYDYEMISNFVADKGIAMKLSVMPSLGAAIEMLDSGKVDVIAYEVPITAEYRQHVTSCGAETITRQVLVQPKSDSLITDVTQLPGREIVVEKNSKYHHRLINLNEELGGGIIIRPIDRDTLITEDMIEMVSQGQIALTVVDSDIANLNQSYYPNLDITLPVSLDQRAAWGVSPSQSWLADSINAWSREETPGLRQKRLLKQYFERSKMAPFSTSFSFSSGRISPFDKFFRTAARTIGWDWRLLASQGYIESRFDSSAVSWAGARGVMQLMPSTARAYGLQPDEVTVNSTNIATAAKVISSLEKIFRKKVPDATERKKFVIAAYNSGAAHIIDAIAIAEKYGLDPRRWEGNVEQALMMKSNPTYYNDPVCHYGYFRGTQTRQYVKEVFAFYDRARRKIPK